MNVSNKQNGISFAKCFIQHLHESLSNNIYNNNLKAPFPFVSGGVLFTRLYMRDHVMENSIHCSLWDVISRPYLISRQFG